MRNPVLIVSLVAALGASGPALAQGDVEAGKEAYGGTCKACHNGTFGPVLKGVFGRKIAGDPEYPNYSDALKGKTGQTWTEESLHSFLKAPNDFAPGQRMTMSAPDDTVRANIIAYLKTLKPAE